MCLLRIKEDRGIEDTPYAPEHGLPFRSFCKLSIGGGGSCCELFYRWDTDPTVTYINAKHIFTANMSYMDVPNAIPEILRLRLSSSIRGAGGNYGPPGGIEEIRFPGEKFPYNEYHHEGQAIRNRSDVYGARLSKGGSGASAVWRGHDTPYYAFISATNKWAVVWTTMMNEIVDQRTVSNRLSQAP